MGSQAAFQSIFSPYRKKEENDQLAPGGPSTALPAAQPTPILKMEGVLWEALHPDMGSFQVCSCQKYPTTLSKASTEMCCPHHTSSGPVGEGLQVFSQVRKPKASPAPPHVHKTQVDRPTAPSRALWTAG